MEQKLGDQVKFFVSFEYDRIDWENDIFGPYRNNEIFEENSNKVTELTIRKWTEKIKEEYSEPSQKCRKVTILFFHELAG